MHDDNSNISDSISKQEALLFIMGISENDVYPNVPLFIGKMVIRQPREWGRLFSQTTPYIYVRRAVELFY
jgi:hypothetical protein